MIFGIIIAKLILISTLFAGIINRKCGLKKKMSISWSRGVDYCYFVSIKSKSKVFNIDIHLHEGNGNVIITYTPNGNITIWVPTGKTLSDIVNQANAINFPKGGPKSFFLSLENEATAAIVFNRKDDFLRFHEFLTYLKMDLK